MERSIRKTYLNAVPLLSLVVIVLLSVLGDNYVSIPQWTQFIIFGMLILLNVAVLAIKYRRNRKEMLPKVVMLAAFLLIAAAVTLYQLMA